MKTLWFVTNLLEDTGYIKIHFWLRRRENYGEMTLLPLALLPPFQFFLFPPISLPLQCEHSPSAGASPAAMCDPKGYSIP